MRELSLASYTPLSRSHSLSHADLEFAKIRVDELEKLRIQRALHNSGDNFRKIFTLLPSLLHFNHPDLIGYTADAPCGIFQFQPDAIQQIYLKDFISSPLTVESEAAFDALYAMGSIGSITQNNFSDIDLWVCHSNILEETQYQILNEKFEKIKSWSKKQGVELNFYLMNPSEFKLRKYNSSVTAENSGSAQHYVLLDEFYRSAIRLAGKRILWLHVLEKEDNSYAASVNKAIHQKIIDPLEWIDFGDFSTLPLGEYFGASLWQLYKGIENPYKSTVKILLLESYAETYPDASLISKQFKQRLLNSDEDYHFDPYLAMLEQVTAYLENRAELKRLECLRYCFYVKAMHGQNDEWKRHWLRELAIHWGWSDKECLMLENKEDWKIRQAVKHQQMLVEQLLQSYRNLINFARKFHIDPSIMPQDTDILMRKLYSIFEVLPGKVTLINEKISHNLEEPEVTFIEVVDNTSNKAGWYLINHAPLSRYDSNKRHVQYQKSLNKLVAWAYFNGVLTANTRLNVVSQTVTLQKLRQFVTDLRLSFPAKAPAMSDDDLYHPNEIRNLNVAVNLTQDPTKRLEKHLELSQIDLFNLSTSQKGIIGSISIIYRNMWNEIITQHIEGYDSILRALKLISNKIYRSSAPPQSVKVFCYSERLTNELQKFVMELVDRCISVQTGVVSQKHLHTFKLGGKQWQLVFKQGVELKALSDDFPEKISLPNIPQKIYSFASEGFLQFFFEDNDDHSFNVYVLDKQNKVEVYANCLGRKDEKIKQISRLYAQTDASHRSCFESFNYPQFYQLLKKEHEVTIVPFQSKQHRDHLSNQLTSD